jgi:hypothetical protein
MAWIGHSPKLNAKEIVETLKEMQGMIDDGRVKPSPDKYRISEPGDNRRNCSYEDVVKKYGNLYNWVIANNLDRLKPELSKMKMSDSEIKDFLKY